MTNKTAALNRLTSLEQEAKELRKIIESSKTGKITDRIKTFYDVLDESGECEGDIIPFSDPKTSEHKALNASARLFVICRVLNEGWSPDWNNSSEYKYYPWFKMSGLGLSSYDYGGTYSDTYVGSSPCFKSSELAEYAGKQFISIYKDFLSK
jgi:hypothetical protein